MKVNYRGLFACFRISLILFSVWFTIPLSAQAQSLPAIFWEKTLGGTKNDDLTFLQQTPDGGYLGGGFTDSGQSKDKASAGYGLTDFWVFKLDFNGNLIWEKTFGGTEQDICNLMVQTKDGGYILGGSSKSDRNEHKSQPNLGSFDYWIIRLDANGNKLWDKTYGGADYDFLYSLQQTPDGGILLGGYSDSGISGNKTVWNGLPDYWVLKLDANGNKLWDKSFGEADADAIYVLKQSSNGGFYLGGGAAKNHTPTLKRKRRTGDEFHVAHFDENGTLLWEKTYGGQRDDYLTALQPTHDGGCVIGGISTSGRNGDKTQPNQGKGDYWVVKLDANGQKKWDRTYGGKNFDYLSAIEPTSDGGFILGGISASAKGAHKTHDSKGKTDFWLVETDARGNKLWDETYGGAEEDALYALQQTSDGGYVLGGISDSPSSGHKGSQLLGYKDFWILKLNVLEPSWNSRY
jgi:hypothetical protein